MHCQASYISDKERGTCLIKTRPEQCPIAKSLCMSQIKSRTWEKRLVDETMGTNISELVKTAVKSEEKYLQSLPQPGTAEFLIHIMARDCYQNSFLGVTLKIACAGMRTNAHKLCVEWNLSIVATNEEQNGLYSVLGCYTRGSTVVTLNDVFNFHS